MSNSKNSADLKAELKVKTTARAEANKAIFASLSNEEITEGKSEEEIAKERKTRVTEKKKDFTEDFRWDNKYILSSYRDLKKKERAKRVMQKYLSNPDLFKMSDSLPLQERWNKIDKVLNETKEKIIWKDTVSKEYKEAVYKLVEQIIKQDDLENNPNFAKFTREHSDIILSKNPTEKNKFIFIAINDFDNKNMIFDILVATEQFEFRDDPTEDPIWTMERIKVISDKFNDDEAKIKYFTDMIFRNSSQDGKIIARPQIDVFDQHYMINDKFAREHENYTEDARNIDWYRREDASLIFGEDQKDAVINFVKWFIEIIDNEVDYNIAMEKLHKLKKPNRFTTYSVLGWWVMRLEENGKIFTTGDSKGYWYLFGKF